MQLHKLSAHTRPAMLCAFGSRFDADAGSAVPPLCFKRSDDRVFQAAPAKLTLYTFSGMMKADY